MRRAVVMTGSVRVRVCVCQSDWAGDDRGGRLLNGIKEEG
jgi:hypothetical protein